MPLPNPVEPDILDKHIFRLEGILLAQLSARGGRRTAPKRKKPSILKRVGFALYVILVLLSAIIVAAYIAYHLLVRPPEIPESPVPPSASVSAEETDAPAQSDQSAGSTGPSRRKGVYTFALLGKDKESGNTDTIIIVTYDTTEQTVGMISIPRDTIVRRTWAKVPKINCAFSMSGPDTLKAEIENTFGIPIDYYIWINLDGFIALVNELDGVDVYIPEDMNYDDPYQNLHIHYTKGNWHLNGQQAMEVIRFRDNNDGTGYTDVGRAAMQRQVLVALAKKAASWNSLTRVTEFLDIFQTYIKTDLSTDDMLWFASQAMKVDLSTGLTQGELKGRGDGIYKGYSWCYVYQAEDILPTLNEVVNPYDTDLTEEDLDLLVPSKYYFNY